MNQLSEMERWIAIMSIMKTSENIKKMPKEAQDFLLINLRREFASSLTDDNIDFVNKQINEISKDIKGMCMKSISKFLGKSDIPEAIKQLTNIIGKDKSDTISKLFGVKPKN